MCHSVSLPQVIVIPCGLTATLSADDRSNLKDQCELFIEEMTAAGIRCRGDFRDNYSPGWKFNHWELKVLLLLPFSPGLYIAPSTFPDLPALSQTSSSFPDLQLFPRPPDLSQSSPDLSQSSPALSQSSQLFPRPPDLSQSSPALSQSSQLFPSHLPCRLVSLFLVMDAMSCISTRECPFELRSVQEM